MGGRRLLFPRALPSIPVINGGKDHERKRKIAVKCLELEEMLERQGHSQTEIETKVASFRSLLLRQVTSINNNGSDNTHSDNNASLEDEEDEDGKKENGKYRIYTFKSKQSTLGPFLLPHEMSVRKRGFSKLQSTLMILQTKTRFKITKTTACKN